MKKVMFIMIIIISFLNDGYAQDYPLLTWEDYYEYYQPTDLFLKDFQYPEPEGGYRDFYDLFPNERRIVKKYLRKTYRARPCNSCHLLGEIEDSFKTALKTAGYIVAMTVTGIIVSSVLQPTPTN